MPPEFVTFLANTCCRSLALVVFHVQLRSAFRLFRWYKETAAKLKWLYSQSDATKAISS
eukprot:m.15429 g.15429  ORF g.15429 m.15429 type:complete len:59 (+) comp26362_c0_seq1:79-255(+)